MYILIDRCPLRKHYFKDIPDVISPNFKSLFFLISLSVIFLGFSSKTTSVVSQKTKKWRDEKGFKFSKMKTSSPSPDLDNI